MALTEARRNEIAYLIIVERMKRRGIAHLKPNEFQRDIKNQSKKMGVSTEEAMEFARGIIMPLVEALFVEES